MKNHTRRYGDLNLNLSLAVGRLRRDLWDDWFLDPLRHEDMLDADGVDSLIRRHPELLEGHKAEQFTLPKSGFTLRSSLETSIIDRLIYYALIGEFAKSCDSQISDRSYGWRVMSKPRRDSMLQPGVVSHERFMRDVDAAARSLGGFLLVSDLHNYFEWICRSRLVKTVERLAAGSGGVPASLLSALSRLLKRWSPTGGRGLPQNQEPSCFLANIYLQEVDEFMLERGYEYYRFCDEFRIICKTHYVARRALKEVILMLKRMGLGVNAKKTEIVAVGSADYLRLQPPQNYDVQEIDALVKTKKREGYRIALPKLRRLTLRLIKEGKTSQGDFRFCLSRIVSIAASSLSAECDFGWVIDPAIELLTSQPWSSDRIVRLLECARPNPEQIERVVALIRDQERNIYEWQGFNLWRLITALELSGLRDKASMRQHAKETLAGKWERPTKAGAIHYLGSCGTDSDRIEIARSFRQVAKSRLMARSAILAVQEVSRTIADRHVKPLLEPDMLFSYERLRSSDSPDRYYEPPPWLRMSDVYEAMPEEYAS